MRNLLQKFIECLNILNDVNFQFSKFLGIFPISKSYLYKNSIINIF